MAIYFTVASAIAAALAITSQFDTGGTIEIYDGAKPATPETAVTNQNLLVSFVIPNNGFAAPADVPGQNYVEAVGAAIAAADPVMSGTATWARVKDSGGDVVFDGNVGTSASNAYARLSSTAITVGVGVSVLSHVYRQPKQ